MKDFINNKKEFIFVLGVFLLSRLIIFTTFWQASMNKGGWQNFYNQTDLWKNALVLKSLVPYCDGQPPLYTTFTTLVRFVWDSYAMVAFSQLILSLITLFLIYKISRLVLNKRLSLAVLIFAAFEPYRAWFDFLLASETVYTPLFLAGLYNFFLFYKNKSTKNLLYSALFIALASLTRSNSFLLVLALSLGVLLYYFVNRFYFKKDFSFDLKKTLLLLLLFNSIYMVAISPWMIRHNYIYGEYALATIFSTNFYSYNAPALLSQVNGTSFDYEKDRLMKQAEKDLGVKITDYADCRAYSSDKYKEILAYFKTEGAKIIQTHKYAYLKVHGFKSIPFFLTSGYLQMYGAYTGDYDKPNVSSAIGSGNYSELIDFAKESGTKFWLYLIGILFWGVCSLAVFVNLIWSFIKKRDDFFYIAVIAGVLLYSALVVSPSMVPRYSLPTAPLFVISLVVFAKNIYELKKENKKI